MNQKIIGLFLIAASVFSTGCSRALKAPDSLYNFQVEGEGFIYGKLEFQNREITQVKISFVNDATLKQKSYVRDFKDHLYGRREDDFMLRIPVGSWTCIRTEIFAGENLKASQELKLKFAVEPKRGSYLGTWVFNESAGMVFKDEKGTQDGKIAEAYPRLNLNVTQNAIPKG